MKEWIEQLNERIETFAKSEWGRRLRITGGVFWNLALLFIIFLVTAGIFAVSVGAGYFASLVKEEPLRSSAEMREEIFNYEETSEIYFANEIYIGKLRTDLERRETSLSAVAPFVVNAVLATEDEYFREHNGIVPKAVIRGLVQDMTNSSTQTGGSTLTQQLIKNQILTNEVSYERKAKEILLAMRIEHFMTKEEILEAYLNIIPYGRNSSGNNIAGIATAAEGIFGVKPGDLNLAQAAYIAGIPQAPFTYTPFKQTGELKDEAGLKPGVDRMKTVLYRMKEVGYITEAQYNEAMNYDIIKDFRDPVPRANEMYPWITAEIESRAKEIMAKILAERDGIDPERLDEEEKLKKKYLILADRDIRSSGYRIYSTIDKEVYDKMNEAARNFKYYGHTYTEITTNEEGEEVEVQMPVQVGSVLMENTTGRIISFVGGRDFELKDLNYATQAFRPNGSTMKPLLAYGPALEYGVIGAGSPVVDVKFKLPDYEPANYLENEERGIIPAREALAHSQNLTALRLYDSILDRKPATFLEKMGFSRLVDEDYVNLSTAIGGLHIGTSVEENTNAFATFANSGQFIDAYMIDKIVDLDGHVIYEHKVEAAPVFSPETSYMITDMMRDVFEYGTGTRAKSMLKFSADFAGKTGTSQDYRDVWLVGYNPNVTLGVWMGYDKQRTLNTFTSTYFQPSTRVNMMWATLMNAAYDSNRELIGTQERFQKPAGVVNASFCGISGRPPSAACSSAGLVRSDLFNRAFLPSGVDDSFASGSPVVQIDGKYYQALASTPAEFVTGSGFGLNADFAKRMLGRLGGDASKLLPNNSSLSVTALSGATFNADGAPPAAVSASLNGNTLSWTKSGSNDVVGYRVYNVTGGSRSLVTSVRSSGGRSISVTPGTSYVVVAVDITGLESGHSNVIAGEAPEDTVPSTPDYTDPSGENPNGDGQNDGNTSGETDETNEDETTNSDVDSDNGEGNTSSDPNN
ncbi:transglycosylase domain-containing protein [Lysinibacillus odysseyi]|uniref:transglycosylase domain-containing protein n=1 Tax=Lysinibacillus odysseyi TaxID=202611 RepID=UPI0009DF5191|nr:transglycosylase domain-containing protein [Lysinibacillus odysseyi]